ncbi:MAG: hypothetical protein AB7G68_18560 [Nitrospiraceae bacterium]
MSKVRIADLKSHLSEYLRKVRSGYSSLYSTGILGLLVYSHMKEIGASSLKVRAPVLGSPTPVHLPLAPPLRLPVDIVKLFLEERRGER